MNRSSIRIAVALAGACAWHAASGQDTMTCGGRIIEAGMTMAEVQRYCGNPASKDLEVQDVRSGNRVVGTTEVHHWIYRQAGSLPRELVFDQDKLREIKRLVND